MYRWACSAVHAVHASVASHARSIIGIRHHRSETSQQQLRMYSACAPAPRWLCGVWERRYIQQGPSPVKAAPRDSSVTVRYVQTPCGFVDVRARGPSPDASRAFGARKGGHPTAQPAAQDTANMITAALTQHGFGQPGWAGTMGFGGLATVHGDVHSAAGARVQWMEAVNLWPPVDGWEALPTKGGHDGGPANAFAVETIGAGSGQPLVHTWHETGTVQLTASGERVEFLEEWHRLPAGDGGDKRGPICARRGRAMLVVSGDYFGYAEDCRGCWAAAGAAEGERCDSPGATQRLARSLASVSCYEGMCGRPPL